MQLRVRESQPGTMKVELQGSLDCETVPDARKRLLKVVRKRGLKNLDMDLSDVPDIDTAGLALLVEILMFLSSRGGRLHLQGLNENLERMISLARLDQILLAEKSLNLGN